jgi:hypothetical protein
MKKAARRRDPPPAGEKHAVEDGEEKPDAVERERAIVRALAGVAAAHLAQHDPSGREAAGQHKQRQYRKERAGRQLPYVCDLTEQVEAARRREREEGDDDAGHEQAGEGQHQRADGTRPAIEDEQEQSGRDGVEEEPDIDQLRWRPARADRGGQRFGCVRVVSGSDQAHADDRRERQQVGQRRDRGRAAACRHGEPQRGDHRPECAPCREREAERRAHLRHRGDQRQRDRRRIRQASDANAGDGALPATT